MTDERTLGWLLQVEAAMAIHRHVYPFDRHWRRWIRTQALLLDDAWYERLVRRAQAVLDGKAENFRDPEDSEEERWHYCSPEEAHALMEALRALTALDAGAE